MYEPYQGYTDRDFNLSKYAGQSLSLKVTVTFMLTGETIVISGCDMKYAHMDSTNEV